MSASPSTLLPAGLSVWIESGLVMHAAADCAEIAGPVEVGTYPDRTGFVCPCVDDVTEVSFLGSPVDARIEKAAEYGGGGRARKSKTPAPSIPKTEAATLDDVAALVESLGRKFEVEDMTTGLIEFAGTWLADYSGTFEFLLDVRSKVGKRDLSPGQAKGVLNCVRADLLRNPRKTEAALADNLDPVEGLDLTGLPSGRYAVPGSDGRLKVRVDAVDKGKWAGWIFVKDAAEYGAGQRYGSQKPGAPAYVGKITSELAAIVADPPAAMAAYGHLVGKCGACGRTLEDEQSIERGIGPVCAAKMEW
jgi:hypothetical protein